MVVVVLELLGQVQERLPLGVDVQFAVHDPALLGAVFHGVPQVAVTGDDAVALALEGFGGLVELVPAIGSRTDGGGDGIGVVGAEDLLGDGAAVDERAAGGLIAQAHHLAVLGPGADVHGVLGDVGGLDIRGHVDAQVLIGGGIVSGVALGVLQDKRGLGAVHIRGVGAASGQSLVQGGLVSAVGGGDDGGFDLILLGKIRTAGQELVDHLGYLVGEGPEVQHGLAAGGAPAGASVAGAGASVAGAAAAGGQGEQHHGCQKKREDFLFHVPIPPFKNFWYVRRFNLLTRVKKFYRPTLLLV